MGLRRSWMRGLVGAGGAAVVVPVGLLLAIVFAATTGGAAPGFGQLFDGPTLPGSEAARIASGTAPGPRGAGPGADVPAVPLGDPGGARGATPGGGDATPRPGRRAAGRSGRDGSSAPDGSSSPSSPEPAPATPTPTPGAPAPVPAPSPEPAPAPAPPTRPANPLRDVVRGVGSVVDGVVRPLPAVGPPVADAVGTVIDLVAPPDRAAPVPGPTGPVVP